ncbi:hypothetical protein [Adlercreutzia caecimuris]|nr:hypothetical protein [Adlercreutzia caecimuris]
MVSMSTMAGMPPSLYTSGTGSPFSSVTTRPRSSLFLPHWYTPA